MITGKETRCCYLDIRLGKSIPKPISSKEPSNTNQPHRLQSSFKQKGNYVLGSSFDPIPELDVVDANIYLIFLSSNQVRFAAQSTDPWYTATTPAGPRVNLNAPETDLNVYWMDEVASPLGCAEKVQFCNPSVPEGSPARCTPMTGSFDVEDTVSSLFDAIEGPGDNIEARTRFSYVVKAVGGTGVSGLLLNLGAQSLTSKYSIRQGLQGPIPENQWQRDVEHWMSSILVSDQAAFVRTATGPFDPAVAPWFRAPANRTEQAMCRSQKILSTEYASFSILGIALTLVIGGLIIVVSMTLESFLAWFARRFHGQMSYAQLEWCTNETLQLQRLVQEELGMGAWVGATKAVPTTMQPDQPLGLLDLSDRDHPRIERSREGIVTMEDYVGGPGGRDEKPALHHCSTDEITMVGKVDSGFDLRNVTSSGSMVDWKG